jgi:hypothetical protein
MIEQKKYEGITNKIDYDKLIEFLQNNNWVLYKQWNPDLIVYQKYENNDFFQISIPLNKTLADSDILLYIGLTDVAKNMKIDLDDLIFTLTNISYDIIKVKYEDKNTKNGNIKLKDLLTIGNNIISLLKSSIEEVYYDIFDNTSVYKNKYENNYINRCEVGQTQIGSYIIPIICPLHDEIIEVKENKTELIGRKITENFIKKIKLLSDILKKINDAESIVQLLEKKNIKYTFFDALYEILPKEKDNKEIQFSIEWSPLKKQENISINFDYSRNDELLSKVLNIINAKKFSQDYEQSSSNKNNEDNYKNTYLNKAIEKVKENQK